MKRLALCVLFLAFALIVSAVPAWAQATPTFKLGFWSLAQQIPSVVGQPLENEHPAANGDSQQRTSNGLMVWRKADNWTAFTDGATTWIDGPEGVQTRLNSELFSWEKNSTPAAPANLAPRAIGSDTANCDAELGRIAAENAADYQAYTKRVLDIEEWNRNLPIKQAELDRLALAEQRASQTLRIAPINAQLEQNRAILNRATAAGVRWAPGDYGVLVFDLQKKIDAILAEPPAKGPQLQAIRPPQAPTPKTVDVTKCSP